MSCMVFKEGTTIELYDVRLRVECEYIAHSDGLVTVAVQKVFAQNPGGIGNTDISGLFAASDKLLGELHQILLNRHKSE